VIPFIRSRIDAGMPVLYFDTQASKPFVHEWSVLFGYDDEQRAVHATDPVLSGGKAIPYEEVAGNPVRFLASFSKKEEREAAAGNRSEKEAEEQVIHTIRLAVRHAKEGCGYTPRTSYLSYASGLAAYDAWLRHLTDPGTAPNRYGMGQLAAAYAEAKLFAAIYLRIVPFRGEGMSLALRASEAYKQAAFTLEELSAAVPFIKTAEVMSPGLRRLCVGHLQQAKRFESAAAGYMEKALNHQLKERGKEDESAEI
jgi:hypothetical protein